MQLQCDQEQGAALYTRTHGVHQHASSKGRLKDYMLQNYNSWYKYAVGTLGRAVGLKDIVLVTGCVLTNEWATAIFQQTGREAIASFYVQASPLNVGIGAWGEWKSNASLPLRTGPGNLGRGLAPNFQSQVQPFLSETRYYSVRNYDHHSFPSIPTPLNSPYATTTYGTIPTISEFDQSFYTAHTSNCPTPLLRDPSSQSLYTLRSEEGIRSKNDEYDQCIFICGYRVLKRLIMMPAIQAFSMYGTTNTLVS